MRLRKTSLLALVAITILPSWANAAEIAIRATLVEDENGKQRVQIDRSYHNSAFVQPGDRITWVCECPPGTEFAVEGLRFAADLEEVAELMFRVGINDPGRLETLTRDLELVQLQLRAGETRHQASQKAQRQPQVERVIGSALTVIKDLQATLAEGRPRALFDSWSNPGFVDGANPIQSAAVAEAIGHGLWKFTWRVRLKGEPESEDIWDPCIYGMGG